MKTVKKAFIAWMGIGMMCIAMSGKDEHPLICAASSLGLFLMLFQEEEK